MRLCRTLGHIERFRDQLVGFPFGNQREDIAVAARQLSPRCMLDKWLVVVLIAVQAIAAYAVAGERAGSRQASLVPGKPTHSSRSAGKDHRFTAAPLDRVASAVDGAESSHGRHAAMWRPDPSGPQGPMQVSEAAAIDAGGGDRFDLLQNRAIGRAYLLQLFWRYGNWPDAIAAYNWGIGNMDAWLKAGRPPPNSSSEWPHICGASFMKAACAKAWRPDRRASRPKMRETPPHLRRSRSALLHVSNPARGRGHPVWTADQLHFPESSAERCNWPCSVRRWPADLALRRE